MARVIHGATFTRATAATSSTSWSSGSDHSIHRKPRPQASINGPVRRTSGRASARSRTRPHADSRDSGAVLASTSLAVGFFTRLVVIAPSRDGSRSFQMTISSPDEQGRALPAEGAAAVGRDDPQHGRAEPVAEAQLVVADGQAPGERGMQREPLENPADDPRLLAGAGADVDRGVGDG